MPTEDQLTKQFARHPYYIEMFSEVLASIKSRLLATGITNVIYIQDYIDATLAAHTKHKQETGKSWTHEEVVAVDQSNIAIAQHSADAYTKDKEATARLLDAYTRGVKLLYEMESGQSLIPPTQGR